MSEPEDDVFDSLNGIDEGEIFLEELEQAPLTWDYTLREGHLIPEANLIQQVSYKEHHNYVSEAVIYVPGDKPLYVCFVYFRHAFDCLNRSRSTDFLDFPGFPAINWSINCSLSHILKLLFTGSALTR